MNNIGTITIFEFKQTAANKAFLLITLLAPFLIMAVTIIPSLMIFDGTHFETKLPHIEIFTPGNTGRIISYFNTDDFILSSSNQFESSKENLLNGRIDAIIRLDSGFEQADTIQVLVNGNLDLKAYANIKKLIHQALKDIRIESAGLDSQFVNQLLMEPAVSTVNIGRQEKTNDLSILIMTVVTFVMLLYMTLLFYGQMIGRSVISEKTSKTVEILISSASSFDILAGKVLGKGLAGIIQYSYWIVFSYIFPILLEQAGFSGLAANSDSSNLLWLLLFFILGFFLYAAGYAALGAASRDEQNMSHLGFVLIVWLILPMLLLGSILQTPDGTLPQVLSFWPLTAPVMMFIRIVIGNPAPWEIAISIGCTLIFISLMLWAAARIFKTALLNTGKKAGFKQIFAWLRHKS